MNKVDFDRYSKNYNEIMQEQHKKFGDIEYYSEYKVKIAKHNDRNFLKILEYGCGVGRNLHHFKRLFKDSEIFGFDISKESLDEAKRIKGVNIIDDVKILSEFNGFFDLVFIAGVYHHIAPNLRDEVTRGIKNLVKDGGAVMVFEHNPYNPLTRKMVNECEFDADAVLLTMKETKEIFKKAGFICEKWAYSLFFPPKLKRFAFIEKALFWLPLGGQYYVVFKK